MKYLLFWAGSGAIIGYFIEIITLISNGPTVNTESVLLTDMAHASPILFALPLFGALAAIVIYHVTRLVSR